MIYYCTCGPNCPGCEICRPWNWPVTRLSVVGQYNWIVRAGKQNWTDRPPLGWVYCKYEIKED